MLVASGMGGMDEMSIFCENQTSSTSLRSDVTLTLPPDALLQMTTASNHSIRPACV